MFLRNLFCGLLALGVIASGRVRRARRKALGGQVVTAIYFHKPNRRLFRQCIGWLRNNGYTFISANDLLDRLHRGKTLPQGAVWLSFDDGCKEVLSDVLPLVREYKIPVTLFIPPGILEGDGQYPWLRREPLPAGDDNRNSMTVEQLKHIAGYPEVIIGSHTVTHATTTRLTEEQLRFELGESKRTLELWTGADVTCFAYPVGLYDGRERQILAEYGYRLAATTENALITLQSDAFLLPRFSVADEISFPEAICNMVGVWRPAIDPLISFLRRRRHGAEYQPGLGKPASGETSP